MLKIFLVEDEFVVREGIKKNIDWAGHGYEFVGLFANAEFVVTNSFHGTVFSINFSKPFYSVIKSQHSTNSRLTSILRKLKLENRILSVGSPLPVVTDIDFAEPAACLEAEREHSIGYIKNALG